MPTQKVVTLYKFEELSDKAKEKAREWWREMVFTDSNDWENVYEDAATCGEIIGVNLRTRTEKLHSGKELRNQPCIWFSGFSCQGDGACFEGYYGYTEDAPEKIREHAPADTELHRIADALKELQKQNACCLRAIMKHRGHYYHKFCMDVELNFMENDEGVEQSKNAEKDLTELMRDFAEWIYRSLKREYEYQIKDATVDDNIISNEYTFLENGKRED